MRSVAKLDHLFEQNFDIPCLQRLNAQGHNESSKAVDDELLITCSSASALLKSRYHNAGCLVSVSYLLRINFSTPMAIIKAMVVEGRQQSLKLLTIWLAPIWTTGTRNEHAFCNAVHVAHRRS